MATEGSQIAKFIQRYGKRNEEKTPVLIGDSPSLNFEDTSLFLFLKKVLIQQGATNVYLSSETIPDEYEKTYYIKFVFLNRDRMVKLHHMKTMSEETMLQSTQKKSTSTFFEITLDNSMDTGLWKQCRLDIKEIMQAWKVGILAEQRFGSFLGEITATVPVIKKGRPATSQEDRIQGFDFLLSGNFGNGVSVKIRIDVKNKPTPRWSPDDVVKGFHFRIKDNVYEVATYQWTSSFAFNQKGPPTFRLILQHVLQSCMEKV